MARGFRSLRLDDLLAELAGVEGWLRRLRHDRGRWPRQWCKGMIRHYDDRRMKLRSQINRIRRQHSGLVKSKHKG